MAPLGASVIGLRLGFFYAAYFAIVGIQMPYWPIWLENRGLSAAAIGILYAVSVSMKAVAVPLIAQHTDRSGDRRTSMITLSGLSLVAFFLFLTADGFWTFLAVTVLFHVLWANVLPMGESLAILSMRQHRTDYGRVRVWGSLGFMISAALTGRLLADLPSDWIFVTLAGAMALCFIACLAVPATDAPRAAGEKAPLASALGQPQFALLLCAVSLIQGSHAVYYAFGTLHWQRLGFETGIIGLLWSEGVLAEIILFLAGIHLARRIGPVRLIALGGLAATLRWTAAGLTDWLPAIVALQLLHAITFGATHLGIMRWIADYMPARYSGSAQALHAVAVSVIGFGIGGVVSGQLFHRFGAMAYLAMGIAGGLGGLLAGFAALRPGQSVLTPPEKRNGIARVDGEPDRTPDHARRG